MKRTMLALCLLAITGDGVFSKAKPNAKNSDKVSKCLKLKGEKAKTDCLNAIYLPRSGEWTFSEVRKSPINDALSAVAVLRSDSGVGEMAIGCYEGQMYVSFDLNLHLSTMNNYFYPIIYRLDSESAVDCTGESPEQKCYGWALSAGNNAAGIWGAQDEFIQEIKGAKKLTVRVSNVSGDQKTAFFTLKDLLPNYEKIKNLCGVSEPSATSTEGEATP